MSAPPVKELALHYGIPVIQPVKMRDPELHEQLRAINPEFIVVVHMGAFCLPPFSAFRRAAASTLHGSLLPRYRGAAPIQWAIINGDAETGVCTHAHG
jgi:methionyl-tRNA formyltransferase